MKIQVLSDLHMEFQRKFDGYESDADVMVLAGDIDKSYCICDTLMELYDTYHKRIIFVPGNHECYYTSKKAMDALLINNLHRNISILNNDVVEIDDVLFIGSTGWWDGSNGAVYPAIRHMSDYSVIQDIKLAAYGADWGKASRLFFENSLKTYSGHKKIVCISHNGPLNLPAERYKYSGLNTCFYNQWDDLLKEHQPNVWIYGHTHDSNRQSMYGVDLVCNPKGYFDENPLFDPKLIIEI